MGEGPKCPLPASLILNGEIMAFVKTTIQWTISPPFSYLSLILFFLSQLKKSFFSLNCSYLASVNNTIERASILALHNRSPCYSFVVVVVDVIEEAFSELVNGQIFSVVAEIFFIDHREPKCSPIFVYALIKIGQFACISNGYSKCFDFMFLQSSWQVDAARCGYNDVRKCLVLIEKILNAKSPGVKMRMVKIGRPVMVTQFNLSFCGHTVFLKNNIVLFLFYCFEMLILKWIFF